MTTFPIYTTRDLYAVMYDRRMEKPSSYWLDLCFPGVHNSDREEIVFERLTSKRKIAPFVRPTSQGKATYKRAGSTVQTFRPAYIKPKDPVVPSENTSRQPGDLFSLTPRTPQQNFDKAVTDVMTFHRQTITRRWEWMAAQAIQFGSVSVAYEGAPAVTVDFNRNAGNSITLAGGSRWGDAGVSILDTLQTWINQMADLDFGGIPNRLTIGTAAWAVMRKDAEIKDQMITTRRGNPDLTISLGLVSPPSAENGYVQYVGTLGIGLDVYVYSDKFQADDDSFVNFMDPRDVVLTGTNVEGVKAFGAILDAKAGLQPIDIFPKMWDEEDPSARMIMSQSAPLMIPVNPNATLRARVVA